MVSGIASVTFDIFRNVDGNSGVLERNIGWVWNYLPCSAMSSRSLDAVLKHFRRVPSVLKAVNIKYNHFGWAYLYDKVDAFPLVCEYFLESCAADIVVGYELSRAQKRLLAGEGKVFVDVRAHPIRFLGDYFLSASTNSPDIHERLLGLRPARSYVDTHVGLHKARAARRYQRRLNPDQGVVFFAQTAFDSSRIDRGEFLDDSYVIYNLLKYIEDEKPKNIYVKKHPHEALSSVLRKEMKNIGAKETATATYDLLSVDGLRAVALSSSVCHEAQYFGARPTTMYSAPEKFPLVDGEYALGDYVMLPSNVYDEELWRHILLGDVDPEYHYVKPQAPFRMSSGLSWG